VLDHVGDVEVLDNCGSDVARTAAHDFAEGQRHVRLVVGTVGAAERGVEVLVLGTERASNGGTEGGDEREERIGHRGIYGT
jgi:hypothetical protein